MPLKTHSERRVSYKAFFGPHSRCSLNGGYSRMRLLATKHLCPHNLRTKLHTTLPEVMIIGQTRRCCFRRKVNTKVAGGRSECTGLSTWRTTVSMFALPVHICLCRWKQRHEFLNMLNKKGNKKERSVFVIINPYWKFVQTGIFLFPTYLKRLAEHVALAGRETTRFAANYHSNK